MTRNPEALQQLQRQFETQIGPFWLGVVGDENHYDGYHLGGYEVPPDDYSIMHPRDVEGIRKYGGFFASAIDVGMGWPASRDWFWWLLLEARKGAFPDVVEIIGSRDGQQDSRYLADDGFQRPELWWRNHISHTHISLYRDSIFKDHSKLFTGWTSEGFKPTPTVVAPTRKPKPSPSPTQSPPSPPPLVRPGESSGTPMRGALLALGVAGLVWIVKRRMEAASENSQQTPR